MVEVTMEVGYGGSGCTVTFFTKTIETLQELHGKRTVDQKKLDEIIKKLEDVEKAYIELPKGDD